MIKYVLTVSKNFPKTHPEAGNETGFEFKILSATKKHTLRGNYDLWKKRFEKIEKGLACLVVRQWTGKPYRSKQVDLFTLTKEQDGIGLQKIEWTNLGIFIDDYDTELKIKDVAENDGLTERQFIDWFKGYPVEPLAVIHFGKFRYLNSKTSGASETFKNCYD